MTAEKLKTARFLFSTLLMLPHAEQLQLRQYIVSTRCNSPIPFVVQALIRNQYVCRSQLWCAGTTLPQGSAGGRSPPCQPPPCPQAGPQLRTPTPARSTTSTQPQVCVHLSCLGHAFVPLMSSQKLKHDLPAPMLVTIVCLSDCPDTCIYAKLRVTVHA